jgi:TldD protein
VAGDAAGYAHSAELSEAALARAAETVKTVAAGHSGTLDVGPRATNTRLYSDLNPLSQMDFAAKTALLAEIDAFARARDPRVKQVMASITGEWQAVQILRPDGSRVADLRPLVRFSVSVVVEQNGRRETGSFGTGGRFAYDRVLARRRGSAVDEALRQAVVNLDSVPAPAGEMEVVLGPGWPGILLHEAIGHGSRATSTARRPLPSPGCWASASPPPASPSIDDGTIPDRRGSITVDDEGTPSGRMVMIEDGYLRGFIQDRQNARLMGVAPTGNGRRQSHAHARCRA